MSTSANTSSETQEIEKGIFLTIKRMNQQTSDGDPVTVHIFTVIYTIITNFRLKLKFLLN